MSLALVNSIPHLLEYPVVLQHALQTLEDMGRSLGNKSNYNTRYRNRNAMLPQNLITLLSHQKQLTWFPSLALQLQRHSLLPAMNLFASLKKLSLVQVNFSEFSLESITTSASHSKSLLPSLSCLTLTRCTGAQEASFVEFMKVAARNLRDFTVDCIALTFAKLPKMELLQHFSMNFCAPLNPHDLLPLVPGLQSLFLDDLTVQTTGM